MNNIKYVAQIIINIELPKQLLIINTLEHNI